jgi:hypothetical protein
MPLKGSQTDYSSFPSRVRVARRARRRSEMHARELNEYARAVVVRSSRRSRPRAVARRGITRGVLGRCLRSPRTMGYSERLQNLLSSDPLTTDAWVQCDSCQVWRRVPFMVAERLGDNQAWFCHQNFDQNFSTCEDPQELEDDEIDVLMQAQEKAASRPRGGAGSKSKVPSNEWFRITRNIFTHRPPKTVTEDDVMICSCVVEDGVGCGADCLNRLVLAECDPAYCPCGTACQNQRFSRRKFKETAVERTGKKGHGLFAKEHIKAGEFILEYLGEVLHEEDYAMRKERYQEEGRSHYYFMTLSSSETIDATIRGNSGRFLNHSCAPNCETQKWMVRGELCIGVFATQDIAPGDEITIDYKFERFGEKPSRCYCMAGACCGWIGGAKAAEAAKAYNVDSDDEETHEADLSPVMHELDEAQIAAEEARGREANADRFTPKKVVKTEKTWRPPEEAREVERQRKERERAERGPSRVRSSGSNVRRVKPPAGSYASKWNAMSAGAKKRTEVDVKMEDLQGNAGGLRSKDAITQCVQLFNLAYPVDADGNVNVATRDLGLLLEAVSLTKNPTLQHALVERGIMQCFQVCIQRLGGAAAEPAHAALLRKILKILEAFMLHMKDLVVARLSDTRTARGTLLKAIGDLRVANDTPLMKLARDFEFKYIPEGVMGPMPERPRAQPQQSMRRNDSGSGSPGGGWGARSGSANSLTRYASMGNSGGFNGSAPRGSAMAGGRGGFGGSAPPGSSMGRGGNWGGRGGAGMGSFNSSAPPQSSLAQAMRPQNPGGYPPPPGGAPPSGAGWGAPSQGRPPMPAAPYDANRGMKRERDDHIRHAPAPQRASKPLLTAPLPSQFEDPLGELFSDAVTAFVTMEVEEMREPTNPLHVPGSNYDRLTARWSLAALTKEQKEWNESQKPIVVADMRARVTKFVQEAAVQESSR